MDWSHTSLDISVEEKPSERSHFAQMFLLQHVNCYRKCEHSSLSLHKLNLDCIVNSFWRNAIPEFFLIFYKLKFLLLTVLFFFGSYDQEQDYFLLKITLKFSNHNFNIGATWGFCTQLHLLLLSCLKNTVS